MKLDVNALKNRAKELFAGFTPGQRTVLGIAVLAVVLGGWLFTKWAATPQYAPLYSNLDPSDASEITEELTARGVPYQLGANGTAVMVPQDNVYQLRLDMSAKGLPSGGSAGYALLDKQGITTSEFRQRVDYQRAMEGELSKTISAIDPVEAATVHLVMPAEDLFTEDEQKPSASVLVRTGRDETLSSGQVQAVVHLVSSSIEGLNPDDVTVADTTGRVLSVPGEDGDLSAEGDARSQQTVAFEDNLAQSIQQMLNPVVGTGAVVRVKADLDFDRKATTIERFENPNGPLTLTESTSEENFTGTSSNAIGPLTADPTLGQTGDENNYTKVDADRQFAVGKITEDIKAAPGGVQRLSVAVLLDEKVVSAGDVADVEGLVSKAAGLDPARGDSIQISRMTFDNSAIDDAKKELEAAGGGDESDPFGMARNVGAVLIVLVVLALAYRSARQSAKLRYPIAVPIDLPRAELEAESSIENALAASETVQLPAPTDGRPLVETHVGTLIDRQPDEVANLLRSWLADRRS
jgi:flagellar M-ring protein FliF